MWRVFHFFQCTLPYVWCYAVMATWCRRLPWEGSSAASVRWAGYLSLRCLCPSSCQTSVASISRASVPTKAKPNRLVVWLIFAVVASARTFGYLKNWVPDGYWNGYPGTRVEVICGCYLQILLHSTTLRWCLFVLQCRITITFYKSHVMVVCFRFNFKCF